MSSSSPFAAPPPTLLDELRGIGLFGALTSDALEYLAESLNTLQFSPGSAVFREGDPGSDMFVVLSGEMEVLKKSHRGSETRVAVLGASDWFGEMSILDVQPRSATVRVIGAARLLRITAADFDALYRRDLKSYALVVLNIARELSRRLRVTDGLLADLISTLVDRKLVSP